MAKGLTSSYLPLGAVAMSPRIAELLQREASTTAASPTRLHPVSCAAAIAAVNVLRDDDLVGNAARLGPVLGEHLARLQAKHPSVGEVRNIGLFGVFELVRDRGDQ